MKPRKRKIATSRYDSADYLKTDADIVAYLKACLEEGSDNAAYMAHALGVAARAYGMLRLAKETGLAREALYRALSASGNPSLTTITKVLKALGIKLAVKAA